MSGRSPSLGCAVRRTIESALPRHLERIRQLGPRVAPNVDAIRRLEQLEGVSSVAVVGSPEDEIAVSLDPERLRAMGISAQQVEAAIRAANANGLSGTI